MSTEAYEKTGEPKVNATSEGGSTIGSIIAFLITAATFFTLGWLGAGMWTAYVMAEMPKKLAQQQQQDDTTVAVTNAEMRVYNLPESFVAHAEAVQEVDLLPQIDGYVKEVKFKEGDVVKEGQLLYVIDD